MSSETNELPLRDSPDRDSSNPSMPITADIGGQAAIGGPEDGSTGTGRPTFVAGQGTAENANDVVDTHAVEQVGGDSMIARMLSGAHAAYANDSSDNEQAAAADGIHHTTGTASGDVIAGSGPSVPMAVVVEAVSPGQAAEDSVQTGSATAVATNAVRHDVEAAADRDGPFAHSQSSQDGAGISAEDTLAAEPSLAHHASAVPETAGHGPSMPVTVEINGAGAAQSVVLDEVGEATSAAQVTDILARRLNVQPGAIGMQVSGKPFLGQMRLPAPIDQLDGVIIVVHVNDANMPEPVDLSAPTTPMQLQVVVETDPNAPKRLVKVSVEKSEAKHKAYLGGYRHKAKGTVYHHACIQTAQVGQKRQPAVRCCREAQTIQVKSRSTQNVREYGTQMPRADLLLDDSSDRTVPVGRYFTSEEQERLHMKQAVVIQQYARGFLARRHAACLRKARDELNSFLAEQAEKDAQRSAARRKREIERRMRPRTTEDFEVLYNELEAWRLQETRTIEASDLSPEQRKDAMQALLHKEVRLLQTVDRLKRAALEANKTLRIDKTLRGLGSPKVWPLKNGKTVHVHTPLTTRARELMHLYHGLTMPLAKLQQRLDVLLHVKWTVKEFDCNLTREIVDLIDREADLLNRGRSVKSVGGLRKRIAALFLAFVETPEFNPEAAALQVIPSEPEAYLRRGAMLAAGS